VGKKVQLIVFILQPARVPDYTLPVSLCSDRLFLCPIQYSDVASFATDYTVKRIRSSTETLSHSDIRQWQIMHTPKLSVVFTDLDGTLLNSSRRVSSANLNCLHALGKQGTIRVIATGRSYYSYSRVIPSDFPADYLIFSSGAGILDLSSGKILHAASLSPNDILHITSTLDDHCADYMVHRTIPDNHHFIYRKHTEKNDDFARRIELYSDFAKDLAITGSYPGKATQIIAILSDDIAKFQTMKDSLNSYQITRATSPLDHTSIWMEIFPENIHKGYAAAWLCDYLHLDQDRSVSIGNDYNDIDLLDFTPHSYLLNNAPAELHNRYTLTLSNDNDGFCQAITDVMGRI
jgi:Cof subfamily protein (haloacid dehalogenase superfamily)